MDHPAIDVKQALAQALPLHQTGRLPEAERIYRRILQADPRHPDALHLLGLIAHQIGQYDKALDYIGQAVALNPTHPTFRCHLGAVYQALGRFAEATASYRQALQLQPTYAEAHNNLGAALKELGELEAAADCFRRATQLKPDYVDAFTNLGAVQGSMGNAAEAIANYQAAQRLQPGAQRRIALATALPTIYSSKSDLAVWRGRISDEVRNLHRDGISVDVTATAAWPVFLLAYQGGNDRDLQRDLARLYRAPQPALARSASAHHGGKIQVGFLSRYFNNHTIGELMRGLIAHLSRADFEVTVLSVGGARDELASLIRQQADRHIELSFDVRTARSQVAAANLDILFYTDLGMDAISYTLALSRLAPVQCTTWGHPITSGIPVMDYFISSELFEPPGAEEHYTERLIRLRSLPAYCYRSQPPEQYKDRAQLGLPAGAHLYACPQSLFKIHPEFDELLAAILRRDPRGLVVLNRPSPVYHQHHAEQLQRRFQASFPDVADRVLFMPRLSHLDYLSLNLATDVLLDPLHFNGGNTSLKALALGTPIVTLPSSMMKGRLTLGLYRKMGVLDCVAASAEEYVERAVQLGTDAAYRRHISEKILAENGVLYEDVQAVRELEAFFRQAVEASRA